MAVTDSLRRDHRRLRERLDALEAELQGMPPSPAAIHTMCHAIRRMVDAHIKREERVLAPYAEQIRRAARERILGDHADEHFLLHDLDAMFAASIRMPASLIAARLQRMIDGLREHMELEEREAFAVADRAPDESAATAEA